MNESILTSIKKLLGIAEEYTHFDQDLIIYINTYLRRLYQVGVGVNGFYISDSSAMWNAFLGENHTGALFDPNNVVCVCNNTHQAIHYGTDEMLPKDLIVRAPNDTCPWR